MFIGVWVNVRVFGSIPLVAVCLFMPIPRYFYDYGSILELEARDGDASGSPFIEQDYFGYPWFSVFPYEVEYCSFEVCEELCWDFDRDHIKSIDYFW